MGRKKERLQIDGQLCFDLNTNADNFVVQANELIEGKQSLKLNSAKIMRALIMQIRPDDDDLKSYVVSVQELARLLRVSPDNLYRDMDEITNDILTNHVAIKDAKSKKFLKIQWVSACAYEKRVGLAVKMNPMLKPFLLNLKEHYTQYQLENILAMKSVYAIRIYEMLMKEQFIKILPQTGQDVVLSIAAIREACDCEDKYSKISQFKERVLDIAAKEIERCTTFKIGYDCQKTGRTITHIKFHVGYKWA